MTTLHNICTSSWKHQKKIQKSTEYLQKFGISYFGIQRISSDGYWNLLTNNPDWVEYSAAEKFYLHDPTLVKPDFYQAGHSYISLHASPEFRDSLLKNAAEHFDLDHCLAIVNKTEEGGEFAFFATSCRNTRIINTYINQFTLLQRFVAYFKLENARPFHDAEEYNIDLIKIKKEAYFANNNVVECVPNESDTGLDSILYHLSKREAQCLYFLLEGRTAKEIAKKLSLSPRTVEEYIDNLKRKTNCSRLHDLFVLFKDRL